MKQIDKNRQSIQAIIKAATHAFAQNDFNEVSLNKICRDNNISKGKLYHYFSSKEDLYYSCINYALSELAADILSFEIDSDKSVFQNLHNYYESGLQHWFDNIDEFVILRTALVTFSPEEAKNVNKSRLEYYDAIKTKTLEIIHYGNLKDNIDDENLYEIFRMVYENMSIRYINKIIMCIKNGDSDSAHKRIKNLFELYDKLIYIMLNGILS